METEQRQEGSGTAQQVQERTGEVVSQAKEQVQQKAQQVRGQAGGRLREQVDQRSTQAGEQAQSIASAIRKTAGQLEQEGQGGQARVANQAAERVERMGGYLRESDADKILGDVEDFARRRPWVVGGIAAVLGFVASRFVKASSSSRYEEQREFTRARAYETSYDALPAPEPVVPPRTVEPAGVYGGSSTDVVPPERGGV